MIVPLALTFRYVIMWLFMLTLLPSLHRLASSKYYDCKSLLVRILIRSHETDLLPGQLTRVFYSVNHFYSNKIKMIYQWLGETSEWNLFLFTVQDRPHAGRVHIWIAIFQFRMSSTPPSNKVCFLAFSLNNLRIRFIQFIPTLWRKCVRD